MDSNGPQTRMDTGFPQSMQAHAGCHFRFRKPVLYPTELRRQITHFLALFTVSVHGARMAKAKNDASAVKSAKTWRKTRIAGLYQHRSGWFFSRTYLNGKENWVPCETQMQSVAEVKHAENRKTARQGRRATKEAAAGNMTFGQALERFKTSRLDNSVRDVPLKPSTLRYQNEMIATILRDWPGGLEQPLKRISAADCRAWANAASKKIGATRLNGALGVLRAILREGIAAGVILSDPSASLSYKKVPKTKRKLPTREEFAQVVKTIRTAGGRFSVAAADFVEGLAYVGLRKREAWFLHWRDIDLKEGMLEIVGDPEHGTKNRETARVPLNPKALALFQRMKAEYPNSTPNDRVFRVAEAQKALDRACRIVGCPRLTHHSLRSMFATFAIEAGVDVPTVAGWLNHKDGGALLMKTYNQQRLEHSKASAQKVKF